MTELIVRYAKIVIAFAVAWVLLYVWTSCGYRRIDGKEMMPSITQGENYWILVKEKSPDQVNVGDIVAFEYALPGVPDKGALRAGRIQAMPGQRVKVVKGELFVSGRKVPVAGGPAGKPDETFEEIIVPRDCYYILMENREVGPQFDSRSMGPLGVGAVIGRIKK